MNVKHSNTNEKYLIINPLECVSLIRWNQYLQWTLRKKCPYSELFWSVISRIRTDYGEIRIISPYSVQMQENADQNNSEYKHFSCSGTYVEIHSF